jgi:hypothetical protein
MTAFDRQQPHLSSKQPNQLVPARPRRSKNAPAAAAAAAAATAAAREHCHQMITGQRKPISSTTQHQSNAVAVPTAVPLPAEAESPNTTVSSRAPACRCHTASTNKYHITRGNNTTTRGEEQYNRLWGSGTKNERLGSSMGRCPAPTTVLNTKCACLARTPPCILPSGCILSPLSSTLYVASNCTIVGRFSRNLTNSEVGRPGSGREHWHYPNTINAADIKSAGTSQPHKRDQQMTKQEK